MSLKKFNIIQDSDGIMQGFYIGSVWATDYHKIGNATVFMNGAECVLVMNFIKVEESD